MYGKPKKMKLLEFILFWRSSKRRSSGLCFQIKNKYHNSPMKWDDPVTNDSENSTNCWASIAQKTKTVTDDIIRWIITNVLVNNVIGIQWNGGGKRQWKTPIYFNWSFDNFKISICTTRNRLLFYVTFERIIVLELTEKVSECVSLPQSIFHLDVMISRSNHSW